MVMMTERAGSNICSQPYLRFEIERCREK